MRRKTLIATALIAVSSILIAALCAPAASARIVNGYSIVGPIEVEYQQLIDIGRSAGNPTGNEMNDRAGGKFQNFVNNNHIYWNSRVDPSRGRQIGGAIFDKWGSTDWEMGGLGYPTTREFAGGKPGSRGNHFEKGEIYWSPATGARIVWGQIRETWVANNYENGPYGLPTSDEYDFQGGKKQDFQGGSIVWFPGGYAEDWEGDDDINPNFFPACEADTSCAVDSQGSGDVPAATIPVSLPIIVPSAANRSSAPMSPEAQQFAEEEPPMPTCDELDARLGSGAERQPADTVTWCVTMSPPTVTPLTEPPAPSELPRTPPADIPPSETITPSETVAPPETSAPSMSEEARPSSTTIPPSVTTPPVSTTTPQPTLTPDLPTRTAAETPTPHVDPVPTVEATFVSTPPGVPSFCEESSIDPLGTGNWHGRSNYGCIYQFPVTFEAKTSPTNVVGSVSGQWERYLRPSYDKTDWAASSLFKVTGVSGVGATSSMTFTHYCYIGIQPCLMNGQRTVTGFPALGVSINLNSFPWVVVQTGAPLYIDSLWTVKLTATGVAPGSFYGFAPQIRCDAEPFLRSKPGCVFTDVIPVLNVTPGTNQAYRAHVFAAQQSGLPGEPGGTPLHRETTAQVIKDHRAASCGGVTGPRPTGQSCDEYPMASTREGAQFQSYGRSYTNPTCGIKDIGLHVVSDPSTVHVTTGYSVCYIPRGQNSSAGATLSWFYTKNRIRDGDPFYVKATDPSCVQCREQGSP